MIYDVNPIVVNSRNTGTNTAPRLSHTIQLSLWWPICKWTAPSTHAKEPALVRAAALAGEQY